jgi:hypothetical protein
MAPVLLLLVPDLLFRARLDAAARREGWTVRAVTRADDALAALPGAAAAVVDLHAAGAADPFRFIEGRGALPALAFADHVRPDLLDRAAAAGAAVASRGELAADLPGHLRRLAGSPAP